MEQSPVGPWILDSWHRVGAGWDCSLHRQHVPETAFLLISTVFPGSRVPSRTSMDTVEAPGGRTCSVTGLVREELLCWLPTPPSWKGVRAVGAGTGPGPLVCLSSCPLSLCSWAVVVDEGVWREPETAWP